MTRLLFVHLSDIHFRRGHSDEYLDPDADLRNELLRDLSFARSIPNVEPRGVLVTGDIAFAGKAEEYDIAATWLRTVAETVGIKPANVWVIPGNHDVDRAIVDDSRLIRDIHQNLRSCDLARLDDELRGYLTEKLAGDLMFAPLEAYNNFARRFGCETAPTHIWWESDFVLNDGSILRLRGLNSVLVSDALDDDGEHRLLLGGKQATPTNQEGVTYVTLCHHPPQWLRDCDSTERNLNERVAVQLFGHKHYQKLTEIDGCLRVAAGATQPDRREPTWEPRYSVLLFEVITDDSSRRLSLEVFPRIWHRDRLKFAPDYNFSVDGRESRTYRLTLRNWSPPHVETPPTSDHAESNMDRQVASSPEPPAATNRDIVYEFLSLPYLQRLRIVEELDLVRPEDAAVTQHELFLRAVNRALSAGRSQELLTKIRAHTQR